MTTRRKREWFDDESFWRELYTFMFPKERIAAADEQIEKALALTKPGGKAALDLCCGPGRCSIALAKRGFSVTGVDKTKYLLDKARANAKRGYRPCAFRSGSTLADLLLSDIKGAASRANPRIAAEELSRVMSTDVAEARRM